MVMIYIKGHVSVESFVSHCKNKKLDPKKCVFIFPGNARHHSASTLYSIKHGGGLAHAAQKIGEAGYPALSLPTTGMNKWNVNKATKKIVDGAIADLYRAVGKGYHLMLPIRKHIVENNKNKYFNESISNEPGFEPSFWGEIDLTPNPILSQHYVYELNNLAAFIALSEWQRQEKIKASPNSSFYKAYVDGQQMLDTDLWLTPVVKPSIMNFNPSVSFFKPEKNPTPSPFDALYKTGGTELDGVRNILNDYTKGNAIFWRPFLLFRHHIGEVHGIVGRIGKDLNSVPEVLAELEKINLINTNGTLSQRIQFIRDLDINSSKLSQK